MSGGSFYYLYSKEAAEILHSGHLRACMREMARDLREFGHADAAASLVDVVAAGEGGCAAVHALMHPRLRDVMQAVEWYRSGDWGLDRVTQAVAAWRLQTRIFPLSFSDEWTVEGSNGILKGSNGILTEPEVEWDEDLALATWGDLQIWIDGGKGLSRFQCTLVLQKPPSAEGELMPPPRTYMRDFMETPQAVQAWVDRACALAVKIFDEETSE